MKFKLLQENLRAILWSRIEAREITGLLLAKQTGFKQAHISNFLNHKRGLSVAGMDKVLRVQHLSVLDLIDPVEINQRASIMPPSEDEFENVRLADADVAANQPLIVSMNVKEMLKFRKSFLRGLRPEMEGDRDEWERFVVIKVDGKDSMSMFPRIAPGANVLIDRHYNSLKPYRKGESNMYAVRKDGELVIRYVEQAGDHLVLRPHNPTAQVDVIAMEDGKKVRDYLIGRICYVGTET